MSTIYIHTGQGDGVPHDEAQARALWQQGRIPRDALYWKEGMADWQPLASYFPVAPSDNALVPPPLAETTAFTPQFTSDPSNLTIAVKTLLWVYLGLAVVSAIGEGINIAMGGTDPQLDELPPHQLGIACVALLQLLVIIATGVVFLMWIYRANLNVRGFGAADMKFTPGWSVGWYFIPIMNLVRPYQAMKEI